MTCDNSVAGDDVTLRVSPRRQDLLDVENAEGGAAGWTGTLGGEPRLRAVLVLAGCEPAQQGTAVSATQGAQELAKGAREMGNELNSIKYPPVQVKDCFRRADPTNVHTLIGRYK